MGVQMGGAQRTPDNATPGRRRWMRGVLAVVVQVVSDHTGVRLTLTDHGRGFHPAQVRTGFGLRSLRQRAEALGGSLHITSAPGRATSIEGMLLLERR